MARKRTIAVDFDGTIVEHRFPEIGPIKKNVVRKMKRWYEQGHTICIWTCRTEQYAEEALNFLEKNGIPFHYFNENPTCSFEDKCRKILADVYLDDRALSVDDVDSFNLDTLSFEEDDVLMDIEYLIKKVKELSLHTVNPNLSYVEELAKKYSV